MTSSMKKPGVALGALVMFGLVGVTLVPVDARAAAVTTPTVTAPTVTTPSVTAPTLKTPTAKTPAVPTTMAPTCASQLKLVKAALKKAPAGPKKDNAKTLYDSAVAASKKHDDKTCLSDLDAASAALK